MSKIRADQVKHHVKEAFMLGFQEGHKAGYCEGHDDGYQAGQGNGPPHRYETPEEWARFQR